MRNSLKYSNNNAFGGGVTSKCLVIATLASSIVLGVPAFADDTVVLPQGTYGTGDSANYYKWETDATTGNTTLVETTEVADITTRYDSVYSYIDKSITNTYAAAGAAVNNPTSEEQLTADFVNNTSSGTNLGHGGAVLIDQVTNYTVTGDFIGNSTSGSDAAFGGAIYFNCGSVDKIVGDFIANKAYTTSNYSREGAKGGAIHTYYHGRSINTITGDFIGNSAQGSSASGGAIYNDYYYKLGNITGDFIGNGAIARSASAQGGAIYNNRAQITSITGDFIGNYALSTSSSSYGGAISNDTGTIGDIAGDFIGNYVFTASGSAQGGAIYTTNSLTITNSNFINNHVQSNSGDALGGAIYTSADLDIIAKDGFTSVFSGNQTSNGGVGTGSNAITLDNANLNFYMVNGGKFLMQDKITSVAGAGIFFAKAGVSNFDEYARTLGFKDTPTDTYLSLNGYSSVDEFAKSQGFKDTVIETFENMLAMEGFSSAEEFAQANGAENMEAFASAMGYNTVEDLLKNEAMLYGDTAEEQFLFNVGCESFDEFLKDYEYFYGDTVTEQFLNLYGYSSVDEYLATQGVDTGTDIVYPTVNIQGDDINNTTFYLYNDVNFANVNIGNTTINTINNQVHNYNFHSLNLTADTNMVVDVDLANQTMDRFTASEYGSHSGNLNVTGMNLLSDAVDDNTRILFAEKGLKDNVTSSVPEVAYTPIYKYNVSYDKSGEEGYFVFDRYTVNSGTSGGTGSSTPSTPSVEQFNPAVLGSSTTAAVGATATMNTAFNYAFSSSADYMNIPYLERLSMKNRNRYALGNAIEKGRFSPLYQPSDEEASVWVKPYATFETVGLKNGPKVHNNTYGTLVGFDSEMQSLKRGWDRVITGYIGYNGASQRYSGVDSIQNGGLIGGTVTMYKGNFFNATTVSVGANVAQNETMYGKDDFAMLLSGVGNKTGYNFEFKEGKLILQPSMLMSYTFVNTFDYTNAAGVRIDNKPLHALQLSPGLKVIGNLKDGWQPYASVSMVWNLMGESDATANGVKLPEMSIKPYVQYGVGVQKRIKDHFTAYGQAMIQNGGRNGISLTGGFRWALGHDDCKYEKTQRQSDENQKLTIKDNGRKIIKQMTPQQRAALAGSKYMNTSRTAKSGSLRQY